MKKLLFLFSTLFILVFMLNAQDTSRLRNQSKTQLQKRSRIHQEDHLMLMDGKLYRIQNGVRTEVQSQVQLHNGGTINPDGSYQLKNAERLQLRNGECLDMNGNLYQNQKMFRQQHMMKRRQMMQNKNMNN